MVEDGDLRDPQRAPLWLTAGVPLRGRAAEGRAWGPHLWLGKMTAFQGREERAGQGERVSRERSAGSNPAESAGEVSADGAVSFGEGTGAGTAW